MREPIRAKLEEYSRELGQAKHVRLDTARRVLRKAEDDLKSGKSSYIYPMVGFFALGILSIILMAATGSNAFAVLMLIGFLWVLISVFTGYDEEAGQARISSIESNIGNINSEIAMLQASLENTNAAMMAEENLDYRKAIDLFDQVGLSSEAKRVRRKMLDEKKVDQTVVHGDYVDDRDTIVKDSVINRSNIGAGGDDKVAKLEKIANLKREGLIDDDEFQQMKKEILGK